jgi:hypothetical protein
MKFKAIIESDNGDKDIFILNAKNIKSAVEIANYRLRKATRIIEIKEVN